MIIDNYKHLKKLVLKELTYKPFIKRMQGKSKVRWGMLNEMLEISDSDKKLKLILEGEELLTFDDLRKFILHYLAEQTYETHVWHSLTTITDLTGINRYTVNNMFTRVSDINFSSLEKIVEGFDGFMVFE